MRPGHCQKAPGTRGLESGVYTFENIMSNWYFLITISTHNNFNSSFKIFSALKNPELIQYVKKVWIPPSPWFFNSWAKKYPTSIIEILLEMNHHTYINTHLLSYQAGFPEVVKLITLDLNEKHHKIKYPFHQQKITSLKNIKSIFSSFCGKIFNYALQIVQNHSQTIQFDSKELYNNCINWNHL
ncbi:uncharacterized protein VP01_2309g1 [Puccinia sorghi]|uniref:Uncharacterized protein n=1 Tax=Puccinia sorghi TaxID=27349 RepID=A0A0L6V7Q2_9BASI|nr:uncharacterized protein VP01_2309g1 [Puccinia sorghi]